MLQFLTPVWFFGLAALSIPVIIHLWNVRPGKTLKVGSISLITEASKSSSRSFKLLDILLLILRCLLLALLAMLLAAPVWQKAASNQKVRGWLLIPKADFKETYQKFKPVVDSLNKAGYEFHYFDKAFVIKDLNKLLVDTALKDTAGQANYWSMINALDKKLSSTTPVYVFSPNSINHYSGSKPQADLNLHWQTYTMADSVRKWIASASLTNTGSIHVMVGSSTPKGTTYSSQIVQNGRDGDISVSNLNGLPAVNLKGSNTVNVDTSTMRIAIYTDKYAVDAGYLKAALLAAVNFSGRKAIIRHYDNPSQIKGQQHWLFWLSDQPLSNAVKSRHILKYEAGKATDINTWIEPGHIALARSMSPKAGGEAIWKDGFGRPVLSLEDNVYHYYSHFNPLWNDLVWSEAFPQMILKLIAQEKSRQVRYDKRVLSNAQIQPIKITESKTISASKPTEQTALSRYFWLLLVGTFIAERVVSHKTKTVSNG